MTNETKKEDVINVTFADNPNASIEVTVDLYTPLQKLEKLVEEKIVFSIQNIPAYDLPVHWSLPIYDASFISSYCDRNNSFEEAITALYEAAVKAYPGRLG